MRLLTFIHEGLSSAYNAPPGRGLDVSAGATGVVGALAAVCAVIAWRDDHGGFNAWAFTALAAGLLALSAVGFWLMTHRGRAETAEPLPVDPVHRRADAAALSVAGAALGWNSADRADYRTLHAGVPNVQAARVNALDAATRAGRLDEHMSAIAQRLSTDVGPYASDVFLAALTTDVLGYPSWEVLTRWWRAADMLPRLPLHPHRPQDGA